MYVDDANALKPSFVLLWFSLLLLLLPLLLLFFSFHFLLLLLFHLLLLLPSLVRFSLSYVRRTIK